MDARRLHYLEAMGITVWEPRSRDVKKPPAGEPAGHTNRPRAQASRRTAEQGSSAGGPAADAQVADIASMDWRTLEEAVSRCTACELHRTRNKPVFGVGNRTADWLLIGEAPGADEDRQGEPFVGRAGRLLNAMLKSLGMQRESVYIANVLKSRPPGNRDPRPEEVAACIPYLRRQIELIEPRVILALGRVAAQNLLETDSTLGKMRGKIYQYAGIPLVVTYHPAYLLRSPSGKAKAWQDLCLAARIAAGGAKS